MMIVIWCHAAIVVAVMVDALPVQLPPRKTTITAIMGFGDSIIDPGNNNNIDTLFKCNFLPYGKDFGGGDDPTGRYSNGKIPTDFLAEKLGLKEYVPAYRDQNLLSEELLTGVSFASGGSGYDPLTPKLMSVIPISDQIEMFKEYKVKLKGMVGEERANFIIANSVALLVSSSNDIAITYFGLGIQRAKYDVNSYTDMITSSASSFVQDLYKLGLKKIGVFSATVIGCVPSSRTVGGGELRGCAENYNEVAELFNSKLSSELDKLSSKFVDSTLVYVDIYYPLLDLIQNHSKYGFQVVDKGCCGTGLLEASILCNELEETCADDTKYLFWDSFHPTQRGYELLTDIVAQKSLSRLFI